MSAAETVQNHRLDPGADLLDLAQRLQARHPRHVEVEHHHVGGQLERERDRLGAVACLSDDPHAGLLERAAQAVAEEAMVVCDHHAERAALRSHTLKIEESSAARGPAGAPRRLKAAETGSLSPPETASSHRADTSSSLSH